MRPKSISPSRFTHSIWLTVAAFAVFAVVFVIYVRTEKQIDRANELRLQSFLLADELRQTSDDLTRMVRTYVITGNPVYKKHYLEILDIRNGKKPRPAGYQNIYWDLIQSGEQPPHEDVAQQIALLDLMRQAGFTEAEFFQLEQAKANSDALTRTEFAAMQLVESTHSASESGRDKASRMLHDASYHQAKAAIMRPISSFYRMMDKRTLDTVHAKETAAIWMRTVFGAFGVLLLFMLWRVYRSLHMTLGSSVRELHARIARLGSGDLSSAIPIAKGMENSVLAWLSATQVKLAQIDTERKRAEASNLRVTQLYAALSQCNQAIVRCKNETELFPQICRDAVTFGGMKMAWIGLLDEHGKHLKPVAFYGSGKEYLEGLQISNDANEPSGRGPIGRAVRENQANWCQDFQHDPSTVLWHERAALFGWGSVASLPLHRKGMVIGAFSLYASEVDAFDEAGRNLLVEMAMDIDYALNSFEREEMRQKANDALRENEQRLRLIIETNPECIKVVAPNGELLEMNTAGLAMLEAASLEEAQQQSLISYILPEYRDAFMNLHQRVMSGEAGVLEFEIAGLKGARRRLETHAAPMRGPNGEIKMLLAITRDVTSRKQAEERIQFLAHYDALTGLPNRIQLGERAKYAISLAKRGPGALAVMFLDLDNFKDINDTLGHTIGDALLVELSQRLRSVLREEDTVSRLGGDEFILLLPGIDALGAAQVAEKLLYAISRPYCIEQNDLNLTASIGIALFPVDGLDLETLSRRADTAMYRAKQEGRHAYRFFTAEMQASSARNLQLGNALRQALERNQLSLHYQPQLAMKDGRIIGAEALLRWNHPEFGAVSPVEFIPIAEKSGLILPIGEWVLRSAIKQAKIWRDEGLISLIMAVNLSAVQFRHPDLPSLVTSMLDEAGLPPEYLELELTEGVAMQDPQAAIKVMNNLHERGVRMSIDDFGTGYSSLSYLKKFKIYKLKIDQSFVRDISTDPEDKAIVGAIISMAKSLGLKTIAEGVETEGQLAFLKEQGCEEIQGYYYSKPLPEEQFVKFVASRKPS